MPKTYKTGYFLVFFLYKNRFFTKRVKRALDFYSRLPSKHYFNIFIYIFICIAIYVIFV